jgi:hypothetical protein
LKITLTGKKFFLVIAFLLFFFIVGFSFSHSAKSYSLASLTPSSQYNGSSTVATVWSPSLARSGGTFYRLQEPNQAEPAWQQATLENEPQFRATTTATPTAAFLRAISLPSFSDFISSISSTGNPRRLEGLYVSGLMALHVVQQPQGEGAYIDQEEQTATQFQLANPYGAIGLLAHNYLAGQYFLDLEAGQQIYLVFGDHHVQTYRVSEIDDFQRLSPEDLSSDFLELASGKELTADDVFARFYENPDVLTLQTCIARGGQSDWGVRFIMAEP